MVNIVMESQFVHVRCDVFCNNWAEPPSYRAFVNNELFAERTWIWTDDHLREAFQILAAPGKYRIRYELVPGSQGQLTTKNWEVVYGPGKVDQTGMLEITHENS